MGAYVEGPRGSRHLWRRDHAGADAPGQPRQDVGEVLAWIGACEAARAKDRVCDSGALAAGVRACKEIVLACEGRADVESLDNAVV